MPELAEVEFYRKQWDVGLGKRVMRVEVHGKTRVFRGANVKGLQSIVGLRYRESWARGKQMLFQFGAEGWVGIHLGMTGKLLRRVTVRGSPRGRSPREGSRHDHLVILLDSSGGSRVALVFADPRQFGRVHFHAGPTPPEWWTRIAPGPMERGFTEEAVREFLGRHGRLPIKGALLLQRGFPGIGNWMGDEILWQSGIAPGRKAGELSRREVGKVWQATQAVSRAAMRTIGKDFGDPPKGWLFHNRWSRKGVCPRHKTVLSCATVAGRTTVWCAKCQK